MLYWALKDQNAKIFMMIFLFFFRIFVTVRNQLAFRLLKTRLKVLYNQRFTV